MKSFIQKAALGGAAAIGNGFGSGSSGGFGVGPSDGGTTQGGADSGVAPGPADGFGHAGAAPGNRGARRMPGAPDLGDGFRGHPFGAKPPKAALGDARMPGGKKSGPVGIPYDAPSVQEGVGITQEQWGAYREGVTDLEGKRYSQVGGAGGRYSGRYQFGPNEIRETARQLGETPPSRQQFLADPQMQERYMERYTLEHHKYLMRSSPSYRVMAPEKRLEILGYAHNQGAGRGNGRVVGALGYLESGRAGHDGFGTSGAAYPKAVRRRLDALAGATDAVAKAPPNAPPATVDASRPPDGDPKQITPWTTVAPKQNDPGAGLMRRFYGRGAGGDASEAGSAGLPAGKGTLHIRLEGGHPGTKIDHDMDGLFRGVTVSRHRSAENTVA